MNESSIMSRIRIPANWVLVDTDIFSGNEIILSEKTKINIDPTYEPHEWVSRKGTALAVPERLTFDSNLSRMSLEWKTKMEILAGDTVYFDYFGALMSFGNHAQKFEKNTDELVFEEFGRIYPFIHYREFFAVERAGEIIPINGYVICEQVSRLPASPLEVFQKKQVDTNIGIVRYVGKSNVKYLNDVYADPEVAPGDIILFMTYSNRPVTIHEEKMWAIQKRFVMAKFYGSYEDIQKTTTTH